MVNKILTVTLGSLHWSMHWCLAESFQIRAKSSCLFAANTRIKYTLIFMYFVCTLAQGHSFTWGVDKNHQLYLLRRCKGLQNRLNILLTRCGITGDPVGIQHRQAERVMRCDACAVQTRGKGGPCVSKHTFFQKRLGDNSYISSTVGKMTRAKQMESISLVHTSAL